MTVSRHSHRQKGQSLLIFALAALVLFAIVGLGLDAGVGYFHSSLEERAAAASALAGVTYMPDGWTNGAVTTQVNQLAQENGFVAGGANNVSITPYEVTTTCGSGGSLSPCAPNQCGGGGQPSCARNRLLVTVCENVNTTFMRLLGFGAHNECRQAVAEYLRPITLGQPGNQVGSDLTHLGTAGNYYFLRTEGYDTDRDQGDAFTPRPDDQAGGGRYATPTSNPDVHLLSGARNTECTSTCVYPLGSSSVAQRGGYNFQIEVPPGQTNIIQVFNAVFGPDDNPGPPCPSAQQANGTYNYHECDGDWNNPTDATQYSAMVYSLYKVPDVFDHSQDQLISQMRVNPIDARGWASNSWKDVNASPGFVSHTGGMPNIWHQWQPICGYVPTTSPSGTETSTLVTMQYAGGYSSANCNLSGGATQPSYYRLRVDTLDNNGLDPQSSGLSTHSHAHKGFAVAVTPNSGPPDPVSNTCSPGCTIGAIDDIGIYTPIQVPTGSGSANSFSVPLLSIPPEYAGQDVYVNLFDPGDVSCSGNACNQMSILMPDNATVATLGAKGATWLGPSLYVPWPYTGGTGQPTQIDSTDCLPTSPVASTDTAGQPAVVSTRCGPPNGVPYNNSRNDVNLYDGTWYTYDIKIPASYNPGTNPSSWYWYLQYTLIGAGANATDTITATVGVNGSPVHLIG